MKLRIAKWTTLAFAVCLVAGVSAVQAYAGTISGTGPFTITEDTQLSGDIDCSGAAAIAAGYCINFGKPDLQLDLNGFRLKGPNSGCGNPVVNGIYINGQANSEIEGPGKVDQFQYGVFVESSNQSRVSGIVVIRNCTGIVVFTSDNVEIEDNIVLKNSSEGIFIDGKQNDVQKNEVSDSAAYGIVIGGYSNQLEENSVTKSGIDGIFLQGSGNDANENIALDSDNYDIDDFTSANTVTPKNVCEHGFGGTAATVCHVDHPTPPFFMDFEVRAPGEQEQTAKENDGSYDLHGEGTANEPFFWLWSPAWAGALPSLPAPPLPQAPLLPSPPLP